MRTKLRLVSFVLATLIVAVGWFAERASTIRLQTRLASLRERHRELLDLRSENRGLLGQVPDPTRFATLRETAATRDRLRRELAHPPAGPAPAPFLLGEWIPWRSWQSRGRATPRATLETALWAAAGGDPTAFESLLEFAPGARAKAFALLAQLPSAARSTYATPEALVAGATIQDIPLGGAEVAWYHESDPDHATVCLLLVNPEDDSAPTATDRVGAPPPMLPANRGTKLTFLSLHRSGIGWRLTVPSAAIDRLAGELTVPTK